MSSVGAAPRAAFSAPGAPGRAATPASNARAEASRKNGAKSRGPRTPEGKARSALNALKHGMRAAMHVVLPKESAVEFNALQALLFEELAPVGALQLVLARRIAVAAWRLARADRMEVEVLEFRSYEGANLGLALMRDGNATRSVETLLRYRGAAMAELTRALKTLKALQAEQTAPAAGAALEAEPAPVLMFEPKRARAGANAQNDKDRSEACRTPNKPDAAPKPNKTEPNRQAHGPEPRICQPEPYRNPNQPESGRQPDDPGIQLYEREPGRDANAVGSGRTLHEAAAVWDPKEPEAGENCGRITT